MKKIVIQYFSILCREKLNFYQKQGRQLVKLTDIFKQDLGVFKVKTIKCQLEIQILLLKSTINRLFRRFEKFICDAPFLIINLMFYALNFELFINISYLLMCQRKSWTKMEDRILKLLHQQRGFKKWSDVAQIMRTQYGILGRNGKQCRQRYHNHLDQNISKAQWTIQEDQKLQVLHNRLGNRWALIARQIRGRTDNCVKNRFYSRFRRSIKNINAFIKIFWKKQFKPLKLTLISKIIQITQQYRYSEEESKKQIFLISQDIKCKLISYSDTTESQLKQNQFNLNSLYELIKQISMFNRKIKRKSKKKKASIQDAEQIEDEIPQFQRKPKIKKNGQKMQIWNLPSRQDAKHFVGLTSIQQKQEQAEQEKKVAKNTFQEFRRQKAEKNNEMQQIQKIGQNEKQTPYNQPVSNKTILQSQDIPSILQLQNVQHHVRDEKMEDGFDINQFYQLEQICYPTNEFL